MGAELAPTSQQRSSVPPQGRQVAAPEGCSQTVPGAVQRLPEQHASPSPPHAPQVFAEQVPAIPPPHTVPDATQEDEPALESSTQQPPLAQKCSGQHAWFGPPQGKQVADVPLPSVQAVFGAVQMESAQQSMPAPPQVAQVPLLHAPPPA